MPSCGLHFVILPIYQEDETLHRETFENLASSPSAEKHMCMVSLENLGRSPPAEKHVHIVLAMKGPGVSPLPHPQDKAECLMVATGHLFKDEAMLRETR